MDEITPTSLPNEILETATKAINFFDLVYSKVESIKNKHLSTQNYLRAYYFEVINNLELLNVVNIAKFKKMDINSIMFRKFIQRLETQIGATILFTEDIDKNSELYKFLKTKGRIQNKNNMILTSTNGIESQYSGKILYESILQAISFTVVKIEILKRLSSFDEDEKEYLNSILIERRIINIKQRLIMIKNIMDQMEGIKEISR